MSTKMGKLRGMMTVGAVALAMCCAAAARADVTSDQGAALLVFPKIVVDTQGRLSSGPFVGEPTDTVIQLTNIAQEQIAAHCTIVDATPRCTNLVNNVRPPCTVDSDCVGGICEPQWGPPIDFVVNLTKRQPVRWKASEGSGECKCRKFPCSQGDKYPCLIANVPSDPFIGEMKCVEVDPNTLIPVGPPGVPSVRKPKGDLIGEATVVVEDSDPQSVASDARQYNAIGLQLEGPQDPNPLTLNVGGPNAEYTGCPNVVIADHLFDDAVVTTHGGIVTGTVKTHLTVVPCTEDFQQANPPPSVVLQFLVFNEFEQRFSTSTRLTCFKETLLSDIDTRSVESDNYASIFNFRVQGTLSGQTRIRSVSSSTSANGVLAVLEEFWECDSGPANMCTTAANTHKTGSTRPLGDVITLEDAR